MLKWLIIILVGLSSTFRFHVYGISADTNYARAIESTNLYKYSVESDEISNVLCIVEKSYFVEIISELSTFYKVNYNGISGFVKKNDVKEITNKPSTPYPNDIKIVIGSDCNLRSSPTIKSQQSNIITSLRTGESNFTFVGRIYSDEAIDFGGTTWYLVNYNGELGYIYNKYIKSITPIYENTESISYKNEQPQKISNPFTHTPTIIIIVILFIPCILILLILYLPRKLKNKKVKQIEEIYRY